MVQCACSDANTGDNVSANKAINSAGIAASPNHVVAQNSDVANNVASKEGTKTATETGAQTHNSSRKFGHGAVVELAEVRSKVGSTIVVPVKVNGLAKKDVIAYEFDLNYDPEVIQPFEDGADLDGTISKALSLVTNKSKPGLLRVAEVFAQFQQCR